MVQDPEEKAAPVEETPVTETPAETLSETPAGQPAEEVTE